MDMMSQPVNSSGCIKRVMILKIKWSLDTYLDQFVIFRLKVADAIHEGYDTTKLSELNFRVTGTSLPRIISLTMMSGKSS